MQHYQFANLEITDQFVSANVYRNNNYIMKIGAEALHIRHTKDIEDELFRAFREFVLGYLEEFTYTPNTNGQEITTKIINMWEYKQKPF